MRVSAFEHTVPTHAVTLNMPAEADTKAHSPKVILVIERSCPEHAAPHVSDLPIGHFRKWSDGCSMAVPGLERVANRVDRPS